MSTDWKEGDEYWFVDLCAPIIVRQGIWTGNPGQYEGVRRGIIFKTRQEAESHSLILINAAKYAREALAPGRAPSAGDLEVIKEALEEAREDIDNTIFTPQERPYSLARRNKLNAALAIVDRLGGE